MTHCSSTKHVLTRFVIRCQNFVILLKTLCIENFKFVMACALGVQLKFLRANILFASSKSLLPCSTSEVEVPSELTSDQTVPDKSNLWSDNPRLRYPLIRLKCTRNTVCARSALETVSDQTFPDGNDLWSDHCPEDCATMAQSKPRRLCAQNHFWSDYLSLEIVRLKSPRMRPNSNRNSLISEWFSLWTYFLNFVIIYLVHKNDVCLIKSIWKKIILNGLLKVLLAIRFNLKYNGWE